MSDDLISKIDFFKKCKNVKQDFSGYSSALRYICEKDNKKYFLVNFLTKCPDLRQICRFIIEFVN